MNPLDRARMMMEAHPLRDYLVRMASKESSNDPNRVSSTGAAGLFQFTRGTGKAYGLLGNNFDKRKDPVANTEAAIRLTENNANILRKGLNREPTYSELALAHQQGAQTAVKMLTGTGNAPDRNLVVNKVPAGTPGPEAAKMIANYYGFDKNKVPGITLTGMTPVAASPGGPMVTAPPVAGPPIVDPQVVTPPPVATPAIDPKQQEKALGTIANAIAPKVDPNAAAEAARITPMSADGLGMQNAGAAQTLMSQLLQARRKMYGTTLMGGPR